MQKSQSFNFSWGGFYVDLEPQKQQSYIKIQKSGFLKHPTEPTSLRQGDGASWRPLKVLALHIPIYLSNGEILNIFLQGFLGAKNPLQASLKQLEQNYLLIPKYKQSIKNLSKKVILLTSATAIASTRPGNSPVHGHCPNSE